MRRGRVACIAGDLGVEESEAGEFGLRIHGDEGTVASSGFLDTDQPVEGKGGNRRETPATCGPGLRELPDPSPGRLCAMRDRRARPARTDQVLLQLRGGADGHL